MAYLNLVVIDGTETTLKKKTQPKPSRINPKPVKPTTLKIYFDVS